jgi:hypothetical protein
LRIKSEKDFWSGVMFIAIGLAFAWGATAYPFGSSSHPGPGYFPLGLGILMALLGALIVFKSLVVEAEGGDRVGALAWRPLTVVVASLALFGYALPRLGLFLALPLLVLTTSLAGDEFRPLEALLNAALLTLGCWLVFVLGLGLELPLWPALAG